jgi:hypothetical protein
MKLPFLLLEKYAALIDNLFFLQQGLATQPSSPHYFVMIGYSYTHEIQKELGKRKFKSAKWKGRDATRRIDIHCLICRLFFHRFNFHIYCDFNENIFLIKKNT